MYEIIIKEIKTETKTVRGEYVILGKRLLTKDDIDRSAYHEKEELREKLLTGQPVMMDHRGYAPDVEKEVESTHEIYMQRVADIDLAAVIKAINKI